MFQITLSHLFFLSPLCIENIVVHTRKQADKQCCNMVLHTSIMWGWHDPCLTMACPLFLAKASCRQVLYDTRYPVPLTHTCLAIWYGAINSAITSGENLDSLPPSNSGRAVYLDAIEDEHSGYVRELFRYAESVIGALATWKELIKSIHQESSAPREAWPTLSMPPWCLGAKCLRCLGQSFVCRCI